MNMAYALLVVLKNQGFDKTAHCLKVSTFCYPKTRQLFCTGPVWPRKMRFFEFLAAGLKYQSLMSKHFGHKNYFPIECHFT
jgi:hypothetical protein